MRKNKKSQVKVNPVVHANEMCKMGVDRARKVAERCMKATAPGNLADIPMGPVFNPQDVAKNHIFWTNVYGILRNKK